MTIEQKHELKRQIDSTLHDALFCDSEEIENIRNGVIEETILYLESEIKTSTKDIEALDPKLFSLTKSQYEGYLEAQMDLVAELKTWIEE